jgi:SAM-dependent methyltransferase
LGDGASVRSSTASLASSVYRFIEEHGRTYHSYKDGKYQLPNDAVEQQRLNLQHTLFGLTTNNRLYLAPIGDSPRRVLDIATGTGIWATDFAEEHPESRVIGFDLSPIQAEFVPANCTFEIDDAEDTWTWKEPFDFIHGRAVMSCFDDHKAVYKQAFDNLVPGGYFELQDVCFPFEFIGGPPEDCYMQKWNENVMAALASQGKRRWDVAKNYKQWLEEIGFEDVVEKKFYWPTNPWAKGKYYKALALLFQEDMSAGLEGASLRVLSLLGWDVPTIKEFVAKAWHDFTDPKVHCYIQV